MRTKLSMLMIALTLTAFVGVQAFAATPTNIVCTGTELTGPGTLTCGTLPGNTISNSIIDVGQYTFITINGISGGNSPYLANWVFSSANVPKSNTINFLLNATNNIVLGVNAFSSTQVILTSNTAGTQISNTVTTATTIYGAWTFNAFISEVVGTNTFKTNSIPQVTINSQPTTNVIIYAPNGIATNNIQFGPGLISINAVVSGGSGTFTFSWFVNNGITGGPVRNTLIGTAETFNTVNMIAQSQASGGISSGTFVYTINAFDAGTSTPYTLASVQNTLVITKNSILTASCTSPGFVGYYSWATVTCTGTSTINNQSSWSLYVDGTLMNQTASVASWTEQTQSGLHTILFKNAGNTNYTNFTAGTTLKVGSLGTGGTPGGVIGPITTTTATTVSTTASTTTVPQIRNQSGSVSVWVSASASATVNFPGSAAQFTIMSNSTTKTNATVSASNVTASSPSAPANYTKLAAFNVSSSSAGVASIWVSYTYSCGTNGSSLQPYILKNGTWTAITQFSVNTSSCKMSFAIPKDPVVGIMQHAAAAPTTTVQPTTTVLPTTTTAQSPASTGQSNGGEAAVAVVIVIIIVVIAAAALSMRKKRR